MYGHYFLTSIGVKNAPWRPYLTTMQLAQARQYIPLHFRIANPDPQRDLAASRGFWRGG